MFAFNEPIFRNELTLSHLRAQVKDYRASVQSEVIISSKIPAPSLPAQLKTKPIEEDDRQQ